MMEAVRTSETSVDNHVTRQYIPEDSSEHQALQLFKHTDIHFDWEHLIMAGSSRNI